MLTNLVLHLMTVIGFRFLLPRELFVWLRINFPLVATLVALALGAALSIWGFMVVWLLYMLLTWQLEPSDVMSSLLFIFGPPVACLLIHGVLKLLCRPLAAKLEEYMAAESDNEIRAQARMVAHRRGVPMPVVMQEWRGPAWSERDARLAMLHLKGDRWRCASCGQENERPDFRCSACDALFTFPVEAAQKTRLTEDKAHWRCSSCGWKNRVRYDNCQYCLAPRVRPAHKQEATAFERLAAMSVPKDGE